VTGLQPATPYHFRLEATNPTGTTYGADATFTTSAAAATYQSTIESTTGLVSYWRLTETSGTVAADSEGSNPGTYVGSPALGQPGALAGNPDTSVGFNGTSQYVNVPYSASLNPTTFTEEAWADVTGGSGTYRGIVGNSSLVGSTTHGFNMYADSTNHWRFYVGTGTTTWSYVEGPAVTSGWNYLVGTYDGTTMRFYLNGALVASEATAYSPTPSQAFTLAAVNAGTANRFVGDLDEIALYSTALSAATISAHYSVGTT
jgi:hypothetical protein